MFTGKAKELFETYIHSHYTHENIEGLDEWWKSFPMEMKFGVVEDFAASLKIDIELERRGEDLWLPVIYAGNLYQSSVRPARQSKPQARKAAIKLVDKVINELIEKSE